MNAPVVLDTDVASAVFKGKPFALRPQIAGLTPFISFVTYGEMTKWAEARSWAPRNRDALAAWLVGIPVIQSSRRIAATGGVLSAAAMARGRPRPQNDMWIAATCLTLGMPLATLNLKDFMDFEAHHGLLIVKA